MADNGSQPGTSAGIGNIINNLYGPIRTFNQHNHIPSTSSTSIVIDYCPAPISTFLGRSEELEALKTLFTRHQLVALVGMGGLGKTQLSQKYVQDNKADYQCKYWLESETPEKLKNSFKELAQVLNIKSDNINKVVNDFYKTIAAIPTILVFDNVEKPADVYAYLPTRVDLPPGVSIHVLVTSRWANWACDEQIQCYKLQPLDISASLQIFQRKFGETCIDTMQDEWEKLARMLGCLPLALQVATSYIYKRNTHNPDLSMVLADYMKQLEEGAGGLLNDPLTEYGNRSVYASMMLTLKQLENKADNVSNVQDDVQWKFALTLINVVAYMDSDYIEKASLLKLVDNHENIRKLDEALTILTEYSLVNQGVDRKAGRIYSMHRIIQTSIRHNQTLTGIADKYYFRLLKYAFAEDYFPRDLLQHANERVSAVVNYCKESPSPRILEYLVKYKAITAMEAVLKLISKNQIQIAIKEHDLLLHAMKNGDLNMTRLLCKYGADMNQQYWERRYNEWWAEPPLHHALKSGNMEIATWLLENGAAPTVRGWGGCNALHVEILYGNYKMIPIIIKTDRSLVNEIDGLGRTPLHTIHYSVNEEDIVSTIRVLVESGADITAVDRYGDTVLHSAARGVCAAAVSSILQLNKDLINIVNKFGKTALQVIPYDNSLIDDKRIPSTIRVLLESGADLTVVDVEGNSVLHSAAEGACAEAVSLILQLNKHLINIKNEDGETALHVLPYNNIYRDDECIFSTIRVLVESGADITAVDTAGNTVLHSAARGVRAAAVSSILQLNKDLINIVNKFGKTALQVIPYDNSLIDDKRILSTIRVLLESGADLTIVDVEGNSVLHSAAEGACAEAVSLILQLNKHLINIKNEDGETALHVLGNDFNYIFKHLPTDVVPILCYLGKQSFARMEETVRVLIMNGLSLDTRDNKGCTPLDTIQPEFIDILLQVAGECNNQLLVRPVKRQSILSDCCAVL